MALNEGNLNALPGDTGFVGGNLNLPHLRERNNRYKIFFGSLILATSVALAITWIRPAVYQSMALLQVSYQQQNQSDSDPFEL
ncbi:MAG: hypothetical protein OQK12_01155, partial [Motiliproteus sp.]|nr:hypothetical protein [Motiliproteus sp.]